MRAAGTVYDGMITGSAADDSTFGVIKTNDGAKVSYTFDNGDSVNNTTASWVKPTHVNFNNLRAVIRTAGGSDVTINAGDSLSMSGTTMGYGVVIVGADGTSELTFTGGKIAIDNNYVERDGYAGGSVIDLQKGSKITFNNTETELGCGGNESENGILISGGSTINFSEQAEKLTVTAANGIVITGSAGGAFTFNSAAGEATINASKSGISFERSGDVVFKGASTVINAGGAAVDFYTSPSGSSNVKENITFGADKTVLNGSNGLYSDPYNFADSAAKNIVFAGTAEINAKNAGGASSAIGLQNADNNKTDITFQSEASLRAEGSTDARGIALGSMYAGKKAANALLVAEQGLQITTSAGTGTSKGILLSSGAAVKVYGDTEITAVITGSSAMGIQAYNQGGSVELGLSSPVVKDATETLTQITAVSKNSSSYGVSMDEGRFIVAGKSFISATSESKNAYGVFTKNEGTADFDGDATIIVSGAVGSDLGVTAQKGGSVNFNRGVKIVADKYSLYATTNSDDGKQSTINVNQSGGSDVVIIGDVLADNNAVINMKLDTADSYFSGVATAVGGGSGDGIVDLQLANQARWDMKSDSTVSALQVADGGVVDMSAAAGYQKLTTGTFTGNGGILIMDTDMSSGESDQLIITDSASAGGTQKILVKDLYNGAKQNSPVLLASDAAGTLQFEAQDAYSGGLYNYKADVAAKEEGGAVNWYLEGLQKMQTADTMTLLQTADAVYAGWLLTNDNLYSRLGELKDGAGKGLWVRMNGGKLKGSGFRNNYQTYQLGYDAAFADGDGKLSNNWLGGAAVEYSTGNTGYDAGSGENKMLFGALYATRHSSDGSNLDIVLKHGQIKGDITTHGINSDAADYKTLATSLSVEYGKRFMQKSGIFAEPQLQLTLGHIGSDSYMTKNATRIDTDVLDSAVGRVGMVVGRQYKQGNVYFKTSLLHEFGGSGGITMLAGNGDTLREEKNYSGTWCELALGGNLQLGKASDLYFDVARSLGGDFQKQWQLNAGLRWNF